MPSERIQQLKLSDLLSIADEDLRKLSDQLSKMIEFNERPPSADNKKFMLRQESEVLKATKNFEEIKAELMRVVPEIKELHQELGTQMLKSGVRCVDPDLTESPVVPVSPGDK
ncbi:MAG: hypothetical protein KKE11_02970 [Gammaproteobacteria bacterium]|nr:hypothetical protein [Gammaproteobacteria bacterium]